MDGGIDQKLIAGLSVVDGINVDENIIELAKYNDPWAITQVGIGYSNKKDFEKARLWWNIPATEGYGRAQIELGCLFFNGEGVEENIDIAEYWFLEAEKNGVTEAIQHIGIIHATRGEYITAIECYRQAAKNGSAAGQHALGVCYMVGEGVSQDYSIAKNWLLLSAKQECREAQYDVALLYENGYGTSVDKQMALEWYNRSYENGFEPAINKINSLHEEGYFGNPEQSIRLLISQFPV
ncbi:HCP-like protein [Backusella circina FSU 941]|nr:HCP-like protein [Backusella circina FSU 941]